MPAIQACIIEPIGDQFCDLLPPRHIEHPLGCHRPRVPDRVVFDKLVQVLVFGCAYERIADDTCSATTLRRRRDEWTDAGVMDRLQALVLDAYDQMIDLELGDVAVDGCVTKAPCGGELAGRSPGDRGKQGIKRSTAVDAHGIPLGAIAAPANHHDSPLLDPTLDTLAVFGPCSAPMTVHLDRGYDSGVTRERLDRRGLRAEISPKGKPAPLAATKRWVVERTHAWINAHKKLVWCTERRARVIAFWLAFSAVIIIVGRLVRQGWTRYRWEGRPRRRP
ncbi:MAG TPA: IS5 family transposase [Thermomicrobiales bacterium]|nr:IS5 family transposase [Thermomicrobiales bacterium]